MARQTATAILLLALFVAGALAQGASRTSDYKGSAEGDGKKFEKAKRALLDQYAKAKGTKWVASNEKTTGTTYTVTYTFPTAEILADFQKWQYAQPTFAEALDKYSLKKKGTGASAPKKLLLL